jgi:predicted Rdx family selenoprotein
VADLDYKTYVPTDETESQGTELKKVLLWDRKAEGGFPGKRMMSRVQRRCSFLLETKVLKQLLRDRIDPKRDLGHSDKHGKKKEEKTGVTSQGETQEQKGSREAADVKRNPDGTVCEDCT